MPSPMRKRMLVSFSAASPTAISKRNSEPSFSTISSDHVSGWKKAEICCMIVSSTRLWSRVEVSALPTSWKTANSRTFFSSSAMRAAESMKLKPGSGTGDDERVGRCSLKRFDELVILDGRGDADGFVFAALHPHDPAGAFHLDRISLAEFGGQRHLAFQLCAQLEVALEAEVQPAGRDIFEIGRA